MANKHKEIQKVINSITVTGKEQEIRLDTGRGLVMRVGKTGRMVFYYYYKDYKNKWRKHKIGIYDPTGVKGYWLDRAIDEADKLRLNFKKGTDPRKEKKIIQKENLLILRNFLNEEYYPYIEVEHKAWKQTKSIIEYNHTDLMDRQIDKITTRDIDKFQRLKKQGKLKKNVQGKKAGNAVINRAIGVLVAALNKAVEWEIIPAHAIGKRKRLRTESAGKIFTDDDLNKLYMALSTRKGYFPVLIRVLLNTGLRPNEAFNLTWDETVDFKNENVIVKKEQAKNGIARKVPMNDAVYEVLCQWKKERTHKVFVFPNRAKTAGIVRIQKSWNRLIKDADLPHYRIYDCRHTAASRMLNNGASLKQVASVLGHSSLAITEHYLHTTEEGKREAVNLL